MLNNEQFKAMILDGVLNQSDIKTKRQEIVSFRQFSVIKSINKNLNRKIWKNTILCPVFNQPPTDSELDFQFHFWFPFVHFEF